MRTTRSATCSSARARPSAPRVGGHDLPARADGLAFDPTGEHRRSSCSCTRTPALQDYASRMAAPEEPRRRDRRDDRQSDRMPRPASMRAWCCSCRSSRRARRRRGDDRGRFPILDRGARRADGAIARRARRGSRIGRRIAPAKEPRMTVVAAARSLARMRGSRACFATRRYAEPRQIAMPSASATADCSAPPRRRPPQASAVIDGAQRGSVSPRAVVEADTDVVGHTLPGSPERLHGPAATASEAPKTASTSGRALEKPPHTRLSSAKYSGTVRRGSVKVGTEPAEPGETVAAGIRSRAAAIMPMRRRPVSRMSRQRPAAPDCRCPPTDGRWGGWPT